MVSKELQQGGGEAPAFLQKEKRESLLGISIGDLDINSGRQLEEILAILKDPSNADHLADISSSTSLAVVVKYYSEKGRKGRVALDKDGAVVGVYDISGNFPSSVSALSSEERPGVLIVSGWLQRLCVKPDQRNKGIGSLLIEDGEKQGLGELGFNVLRGAIVLSEDQMDFYRNIALTTKRTKIEEALTIRNIELHQGQIALYDALEEDANEFSLQQAENFYKSLGTDIFLDWLAITDPRGRAFIKSRGWKFNTILIEQTRVESTGKNHPVLVVEKLKLDWEQEQKENKKGSHKKVIDVAKRVPDKVNQKLL